MVLSALLSFLGGSVFRLFMGEVMNALKSRQENSHELNLMKAQAEIAAAEHARNLEAIKVQAELGVKTIQVQGETDVALAEAQAFRDTVAAAIKPTGIVWVDAWNASVRPAFATTALVLWFVSLYGSGFKLSDWDTQLMAVIIGFYFADRSLRKNGR